MSKTKINLSADLGYDVRSLVKFAERSAEGPFASRADAIETSLSVEDNALTSRHVTEDLYVQQDAESGLSRLTDRQKLCLKLVSKGLPNKAIASAMSISEGTVKLHLHAAFKTLGVRNRSEAVYLFSNRSSGVVTSEVKEVN